MKYFSKISITCLILILCTLVTTLVIAERDNVVNQESAGQAGAGNLVSDNFTFDKKTCYSLPFVHKDENVINPSSGHLGGNTGMIFTDEYIGINKANHTYEKNWKNEQMSNFTRPQVLRSEK